MKLKQVRMLCMIAAIGAATATGCLEAGGGNYGNRGMKTAAEAVAKSFITVEGLSGITEEAETSAHTIPEVGSGIAIEQEAPEETAQEAVQEEAPQESSLIIANVTDFVNIRSLPNEEGEILGKLHCDAVGTRQGEENGWYYITSGSVTGYVKADYVLTGAEAEQRAAEKGRRLAEVTTQTLNVRTEPTTEALILGMVPGGDILEVLSETEGWAEVLTNDGAGFVSTEFVRIYTENKTAESREEEEARIRKEEEEKRAAEAKRAAAASKSASGNKSSASGSAASGNTASGNAASGGASFGSTGSSQSSDSELGTQIVNYALQFVGNPYVYGGTSLTDGADCSGFVMSVFANFGISLPRTSGEQGASGSSVDGLGNAKPGDLIWYSGHIGIYTGNGQIVHASNSRDGIIVSKADYRPILSIRRIV